MLWCSDTMAARQTTAIFGRIGHLLGRVRSVPFHRRWKEIKSSQEAFFDAICHSREIFDAFHNRILELEAISLEEPVADGNRAGVLRIEAVQTLVEFRIAFALKSGRKRWWVGVFHWRMNSSNSPWEKLWSNLKSGILLVVSFLADEIRAIIVHFATDVDVLVRSSGVGIFEDFLPDTSTRTAIASKEEQS